MDVPKGRALLSTSSQFVCNPSLAIGCMAGALYDARAFCQRNALLLAVLLGGNAGLSDLRDLRYGISGISGISAENFRPTRTDIPGSQGTSGACRSL